MLERPICNCESREGEGWFAFTCGFGEGKTVSVDNNGWDVCELARAECSCCRICLCPCFRLRCGGTASDVVEEFGTCDEDASRLLLTFEFGAGFESDWFASESNWSEEGGIARLGLGVYMELTMTFESGKAVGGSRDLNSESWSMVLPDQ